MSSTIRSLAPTSARHESSAARLPNTPPTSKGPLAILGAVVLLLLPSVSSAQTAVLRMDTVQADASGAATLSIEAEASFTISGLSLGICFDPAAITTATLSPCGTCTFDYFVSESFSGSMSLAIIPDLQLADTLPAATPHVVASLDVTLAPSTQAPQNVVFCTVLEATPVVDITFVDGNASDFATVDTVDGLILPPGGGNSFVRGDVNGDGSVSIPDAIVLLTWLFLGDDTPTCMQSADIDGNGSMDGIPEAIRLLEFLFLGATAPAAPYPQCGTDLQSNLDCAAPTSSCTAATTS